MAICSKCGQELKPIKKFRASIERQVFTQSSRDRIYTHVVIVDNSTAHYRYQAELANKGEIKRYSAFKWAVNLAEADRIASEARELYDQVMVLDAKPIISKVS